MMPSNHANMSMNADSGWDFTKRPHNATSLVRENCTGAEAWGPASDEDFCAAYGDKSPCQLNGNGVIMNRNWLMSEINNSSAAFAITMPSTAWLGYSHNLYYAQL